MAPQLPTILVIVSVIMLCSRSMSETSGSKQKTKIKGLQFRMIHIDSPESPMYEPKLTNLERKKRLMAMSDYRMYHLTKNITQLRISRMIHNEPDVISPQLEVYGAIFFVEIGLGQFVNGASYSVYLMFDTGSDHTWTQCQGCSPCTPQNTPLFPWSLSSTYHSLEYNECPPGRWDNHGGYCMNEITYTDGGRMKGVISSERFTFIDPFFGTQSIDGLIFTCAFQTYNIYYGMIDDNKMTGMLGMGTGPLSLISQLGNVANYQFSYCLQDTLTYGQAFSTFLRFGEYIRRLPLMSVTSFETPPGKEGYYVGLIDISVNGRRLNIPEHLFELNADNSGGTIIDSGTPATYINSDAFDMLAAAITSYVSNNNPFLHTHLNPPGLGMDVCWEPIFDVHAVNFPTLTFHFKDNAFMLVQPHMLTHVHTFPDDPHRGMNCLLVKRIYGGVNVIGTVFQANQLLIYDLRASTISIAATDCSNQG